MCYILPRRNWFSSMGEIQKRDAKFKARTRVCVCVCVCARVFLSLSLSLSSGMAYLDIKGKATTVAGNTLQQNRVRQNS